MTEWSTVRRRYEVALVGVLLYVVLDAVVQLLPPHYSPISQAESDLAVGPYGYIMTLNFLNRGALSLEFLFALMGTVRLAGEKVSRYRSGFYLLGMWSVGALLLAVFPTDVPSTPVSWHGAIHLIVAVIAFIGGGFGALMISVRMNGEVFRVARRFALPMGVLSVVFLLVEVLGPFSAPHLMSDYGGLVERVFLGSLLAWISAVAAYMLRNRKLSRDESAL
jgi:hypothetical membrane protein